MIRMTLTSGPFVNRTRDVTANDPNALFDTLIGHLWHWKVDYSAATEAEKLAWGLHDVSSRMLLALLEGRKVFVGPNTYTSFDEWEALGDAIEGLLIKLETDTPEGVRVTVVDFE